MNARMKATTVSWFARAQRQIMAAEIQRGFRNHAAQRVDDQAQAAFVGGEGEPEGAAAATPSFSDKLKQGLGPGAAPALPSIRAPTRASTCADAPTHGAALQSWLAGRRRAAPASPPPMPARRAIPVSTRAGTGRITAR